MMRSRLVAFVMFLALISSAHAAHDFDSFAVESYAEGTSAEVTAPPFSACCWFNSDSATVNQTVISVHRNDATTGRFIVAALGNSAGDPIIAQTTASASSGTATTSTGYSVDTWHHACGVFTAADSRAAYLDGGGKGTNTTSITPSSIARTSVAMTRVSSTVLSTALLDGSVAECGVWSVALSDGEVAELAKGYAPPCVRPAALKAYYPSIRQTGALFDHTFGSVINNLSIVGGNAVVAHPPGIKYCQ